MTTIYKKPQDDLRRPGLRSSSIEVLTSFSLIESFYISGIRFHDTEDTFGQNFWSNPLHLAPYYGTNDMEQNFCMRTVEKANAYDWEWPQGEYCVFKMGPICPLGL